MNNELFTYHKNALLNHLCKEWDSRWNACRDEKESLVKLVMCQQSLPHFFTYCHEGKGLSRAFILDHFKDYINGAYTGINADGVEGDYKTRLYVDYSDIVDDPLDVASFQWCDNATFSPPVAKSTKIYVGCSSNVHIACDGYNSIVVMLFDDSEVWLDDVDEDSNITIYRYSDDAKVNVGKFCMSYKIKEFRKELRL